MWESEEEVTFVVQRQLKPSFCFLFLRLRQVHHCQLRLIWNLRCYIGWLHANGWGTLCLFLCCWPATLGCRTHFHFTLRQCGVMFKRATRMAYLWNTTQIAQFFFSENSFWCGLISILYGLQKFNVIFFTPQFYSWICDLFPGVHVGCG